MIRTTATILAVLSIAACSAEPPASTANTTQANTTQANTPVGSLGGVDPAANATVASTRGLPTSAAPHPAPALEPMEYDDFKRRDLLGSGCTFHAGVSGPTLLLVRDEGDGLVKYDRRLRRVSAATPGRDAIQGGGILAGDGVSFTVARLPGDGEQVGVSSRAWPATLTMRTDDGGERIYRDGRWECGS